MPPLPKSPKQTVTEQKEARLETVRQQFWPEDITQIQELEKEWRKEPLSYLLCQAMHVGTLVLSTSSGPRVATGRYGLYTSEELVAELGPRLAAATLFLERNGYSIIPVPAGLTPLAELFTQRKVTTTQLSPVDLRDYFREREYEGETTAPEEDDDRWRFWKSDMQQLKVLEAQWKRDRLVYLRCIALHIGVLVLSASGAPSRTNWRYGLYTAAQLAEALSSCLACAIQFLERNGFSLIPIPTTVITLIELVAKLGIAGGPSAPSTIPSSVPRELTQKVAPVEETLPSEQQTVTRRAVISESQRKRRSDKDGDI